MKGMFVRANLWMIFIVLAFGFSACGVGDTGNQAQTGPLSFNLKWVAPAAKPGGKANEYGLRSLNCASIGVSIIYVNVTNNVSTIASGGPFACSNGSGTISAVPIGSNYTVSVLGESNPGTILYTGQQTGVSVTAGGSDAGTITMTSTGTTGGTTTPPPTTGTTTVQKVPATGQTTVYQTGDNGTYSNINPMSYTDNGNGTITDNVTGLMWQKQDSGQKYSQVQAIAYCSGLSLGGHSDWRLPSRMNLITIVNYGSYNPAINQIYFPSTQSYDYWSSTASAVSTTYAWYVYFGDGNVVDTVPVFNDYARCVRLGQTQAQSFSDNGNGTITDNVTGLIWQKQDSGQTYSWPQAITYCSGLSLGGLSGWRLPNIKELSSIVDDTVSSPAINQTYFPSTHLSRYWSSTTYAGVTANAWNVSFLAGYVLSDFTTLNNYARCVRLGQ